MPLLILIIFAFNIQGFSQDKAHKPPFWKKQKVQEQMLEKDLVVVSAKTSEIDKPKDQYKYDMKVQAAGVVKAPLKSTYRIIREFEKLPKVDDRFKEVRYNPKTKDLYLHISTLGLTAKMYLKLQEKLGKNYRELKWTCVGGAFKGMVGTVRMEKVSHKKTEVSLDTDYKSVKLPLPKVLMGLGLEIIGRQVAEKMREFIVQEYRNKGY